MAAAHSDLGGALGKHTVVPMPSMCEDCGTKQANYGAKDDMKKRWCSGRGAKHGALRNGPTRPNLLG